MYIKKYWGNFIGGSDEQLNSCGIFKDQKGGGSPRARSSPNQYRRQAGTRLRRTREYLELHVPMVWRWTFTSPDVVADLHTMF